MSSAQAKRNKRTLWQFTRRCHYCDRRLTFAEATVDHLYPKVLGGTARLENIVLACEPCNQSKGCRVPQRAADGSIVAGALVEVTK